ncbi:cation:proton antiporter [Streptomyces sp. NPDC094468]|uniref:cation:proton antiporter domain-containing protein n=1 Tax=Streptomyces sp. NPDC094468 TaxID=3366066 RepID=UPI003813FAB0
MLGSSAVCFVVLRHFERTGKRRRLHRLSQDRKRALELRISLAVVFALATIAVRTHVSIMLAGFCLGLVVAAVGEPRRLARQLFAVTEGFFGPLFFLWLSASLDLSQLGGHPSFILLGLLLGTAAVAVHATMRLTGQPTALAVLYCASQRQHLEQQLDRRGNLRRTIHGPPRSRGERSDSVRREACARIQGRGGRQASVLMKRRLLARWGPGVPRQARAARLSCDLDGAALPDAAEQAARPPSATGERRRSAR